MIQILNAIKSPDQIPLLVLCVSAASTEHTSAVVQLRRVLNGGLHGYSCHWQLLPD